MKIPMKTFKTIFKWSFSFLNLGEISSNYNKEDGGLNDVYTLALSDIWNRLGGRGAGAKAVTSIAICQELIIDGNQCTLSEEPRP